MRRQASPDDLTRNAQLIEQLRRVLSKSAPQHVGFPGCRRYFVTLQLLDDVERSVWSMELCTGLHVLPVDRNRTKSRAFTGSISRRRRPSVSRWMRARRRRLHHSISLSSVAADAVKRPRRTCPSASSRSSADSITSRAGRIAAKGCLRLWSARLEPSAHVSVTAISWSRCRRAIVIVDRRSDGGIRIQQARRLEALRGDPEVRAARAQHRRASCFHERPEVLLPLTHRRQDDQRQQRVVQLVGIADDRPRFGRHLGDRGRIERADVGRVRPNVRRICTARARRSSSGASSRYAYGFAFRISCENGDGSAVSMATVFDSPRRDAAREPLQAVEIHRLVQAVADRLVDQRMIGNADVADDVFPQAA